MARFCSSLRGSLGTLVLAAVVFGGTSLASVALSTSAPASAQDQPAGGGAPAGRGHRMGQILMSLNLSDTQKSQIKAIMADVKKQNANVTDRDQKRANYKAAMAKVETVLTPAQRTQFDAKMAAARQQDPTPHA